MRVSELAKKLGATSDTVRFYTRIEYLAPKKNKINGYKEYGEKEMHRLRFIMSARQLGFSVDDIGEIINEAEKGRRACPLVRKLIVQRLEETEKGFAETIALRDRMKSAVKAWEKKPDMDPTGDMICHLIEEF